MLYNVLLLIELWQTKLQSIFADIPGYARDHAVCGVNIRYFKQST